MQSVLMIRFGDVFGNCEDEKVRQMEAAKSGDRQADVSAAVLSLRGERLGGAVESLSLKVVSEASAVRQEGEGAAVLGSIPGFTTTNLKSTW